MNLDNADLAATLESGIHRLTDAAAAAIDLANMFALIGAVFFVATLLMRTIVPLRIAALISNVFFIGYGVLSNSINTIILYCLLLPINSVRLYQMIRLISAYSPVSGLYRWKSASPHNVLSADSPNPWPPFHRSGCASCAWHLIR